MKFCIVLFCLVIALFPAFGVAEVTELVYAEMEFPLSFVSHIQQFQFNPLSRFQTEIEGRLIRLTCDPLIDIYQVTSGQQAYRQGLASWRTLNLRTRQVLNFNLVDAKWPDGKQIGFEDVWFSLEYMKLSPLSWGGSQNLVITEKGSRSIDAYIADASQEVPKPGEFYFPIVNKMCFKKNELPREASVSKNKQQEIGYGRYTISEIEENRFIRMQRRGDHVYYQNLHIPAGYNRLEQIRMQAFPGARISRNEQFIEGRVHLLTSATQSDVGYIVNAYPKAKVERYNDDSFTSFVFNCRHPYLQAAPVRRAMNYLFRKKLALKKSLGGEGEIISGPLPSRNFFYNINVPVYEDDIDKAIAVFTLYRYWGLDVYEEDGKVLLLSEPLKGPAVELKAGDQILDVEGIRLYSLRDLASALQARAQEKEFRVKVARGPRILVQLVQPVTFPQVGIWTSVAIANNQLQGFPELSLIANNPEGKDPFIKEICGALKEDLAKIGIGTKIDYLDGAVYYPRLQNGDFELAFRTLKLTGTPSLYRMFYRKVQDSSITNTNYGSYLNPTVNDMAWSSRDITDVTLLDSIWKKAHVVLHHDPPYLFLWSRRHILMYDPRIEVLTPGAEYEVPHGYKQINGLINIFNEVHLWAMKNE
jgi:ABC-type transport system substrate-binding protein